MIRKDFLSLHPPRGPAADGYRHGGTHLQVIFAKNP